MRTAHVMVKKGELDFPCQLLAFKDSTLEERVGSTSEEATAWVVEYNHGHWTPPFQDKEEAERMLNVLKGVYDMGYLHAKWELRQWLGVPDMRGF